MLHGRAEPVWEAYRLSIKHQTTKRALLGLLDGQLCTAFATARAENFATRRGAAAHQKAVGGCALALLGLVGSL